MKLMLSNSLSKKLLSKYDKNKKNCQIYKNFPLTKRNNNNLTIFNSNLQNNGSERNLISSEYSIENKNNKIYNYKSIKIPNFSFEILKPKKQVFKKEISEEKIDEMINNIKFGITELKNGNFIINTIDFFELDINNEKKTFFKFNDKLNKKLENKSAKNIIKKTIIPLNENMSDSLKKTNIPLHIRNKNIISINNKKKDIKKNKEPKILFSKQNNILFENQIIVNNNLHDKENLSSSHSNANTSTGLTNMTKVNKKETNQKNTITIIKNINRKTSQSPKYCNIKILGEILMKNKKNKSPKSNKSNINITKINSKKFIFSNNKLKDNIN